MSKNYANDIYGLAKQFFWNMTQEEVLSNKKYFIAHLMANAPNDIYDHLCNNLKFTKEDFIEALKFCPPGVFFMRDNLWKYWNDFLGINPHIPMPRKYNLDGTVDRREIPGKAIFMSIINH
jgi:hypothetical protein